MKTQIKNSGIQNNGRHHAFTLVEMLLVVTIIGILAALVIPRLTHRTEDARQIKVLADINGGIKSALSQYEIDCGTYPKSLQDLLVQPSGVARWRGPYLDKPPVDPWGNAYVYHVPGRHSVDYDLLSIGPDGKEGTADDIGNWQ
jgi:general secretion pathway protein G